MYTKEPFAELDVMSDFLNNLLASDPDFGKDYCRLMIKNLTGMEIKNITVHVQKILPPTNPELRGIRLDVLVNEYSDEEPELLINMFDFEPHRGNDIDSHPRQSRFYQAKIDSGLLKSGDKKFADMPNLFIISITNYDPFGEDYMVYTIKNSCVEIPEMCYDDGIVRYFFNTTGNKGGSKELKDFLVYLENSVDENVSNDEIRRLSELVNKVKSDKNEEDRYMTVGDRIDSMIKAATAEINAELAASLAENEANHVELAKKDAELARKDAENEAKLAEKDAEIELLKQELENARLKQ